MSSSSPFRTRDERARPLWVRVFHRNSLRALLVGFLAGRHARRHREPARPLSVRVFHPNTLRALVTNCMVGPSTFTEVFTFTMAAPFPDAEPESVADIVFDLFNVGDDPSFGEVDARAVDYRACGNRSLSVGDVVSIDGLFLVCAASGWDRLPAAPPLRQATGLHGTTPLY